jgi:hypothetical protein
VERYSRDGKEICSPFCGGTKNDAIEEINHLNE